MSDHKHEAQQERIEIDEQARHEAGQCEGIPLCTPCLEEWEEAEKEELAKQGYTK